MEKMYALQPNESINDHVKDSKEIITHIVKLSISCMRDLANPHEGTFIDMTYNKFMRSLEHIRESVEMLDELCDELENDNEEIRHEYEEKVIQFFNRFMSNDADFSIKLREAKEHSSVYWKDQFDRMCKKSNQLEEQLTGLKGERDLAKKLAKKLMDEKRILKDDLTRSELECKVLREMLDKKYAEIESLTEALINDASSPNSSSNFCGNCTYFEMSANDVGICARLKERNKFKVVDPDDSSCKKFKPPFVSRPDHPVCSHCDHEECDDCSLYPF